MKTTSTLHEAVMSFGSALQSGLGLLSVALIWCCGCGRNMNEARYIPSPAAAREVLELALAAWQRGEPPGNVPGYPVRVAVYDSCRRPKQRLKQYEILGEAAGDSPRCFAVRLYLENPVEEVTARYVVIGIDPLRVFRHEDLEMVEHWQCTMPEESQSSNLSK